MTFADQYKAHAYADLIREAETWGIIDGIGAERERIRSRIKKRIEELSSCTKDDDCAKIADYIESYLPEWVWE
jgi:hypothetical protein